jgi:uncharacterized protein with GYD domain
MSACVLLGTFTDQGIHNVKDTIKRADSVRAMAKKAGIVVTEIYWTLGQFDVVLVLDAPDEAAATSLALTIGSLGNVRTQLMRAFTADEIVPIVRAMPKPARGR